MDAQEMQLLYLQHVATFLKYRVGSQLAERITAHVIERCPTGEQDPHQAFGRMLADTLEFAIGPNKVLPLVFDREELAGFQEKFLSIVDKAPSEHGASDFTVIFNDLVAGYLEDILGKELVASVRKVFLKAVSAIPDQPLDVRFYMGMQAVYQFIPDVWSELEFAEKVKELSSKLPQEETAQPVENATHSAGFEDLVEKIVVSDLADILGRGHALETVINSAEAKMEGIFYNDLERFKTFIEQVLADDFITRMFDLFWIEECRKKWIQQAELILE